MPIFSVLADPLSEVVVEMSAEVETNFRGDSRESPTSTEESYLVIRWLFPVEKSSTVRLNTPRLRLGRSEACDFVLEDPAERPETSRFHAEIRKEDSSYVLYDSESTNGVFVNGRQVGGEKLEKGHVVRLGTWIGIVDVASEARTENAFKLRELGPNEGPEIWGSHVLAAVMKSAREVALSDLPIIVQGETGTGKELFAKAIHIWSQRPGNFIAFNCAAIPEPLAEAELFGYVKGAFYGASKDRKGYFRDAEGGTLFLDEISDLPSLLQTKLLRVLAEREVTPLGQTKPVGIDVRIVVAVQEPLEEKVSNGTFRKDLHARLSGPLIKLPPLRDRIGDVPGLFIHFLRNHVRKLEGKVEVKFQRDGELKVEPQLVERLLLYSWPKNARELEMLAGKLVALQSRQKELLYDHLPDEFRTPLRTTPTTPRPPEQSEPEPRIISKKEEDARDLKALQAALLKHGGHLTNACKEIGISRQRAYRLIKKTMNTVDWNSYGIESENWKDDSQ